VGLSLSQPQFAKKLGFASRTIGNAERGTHPPSLALRRALDQALEQASDTQRNRFLAAVATLQEDCTVQDSKAHDTWHVASLPRTDSRWLAAHLDDIEQRDETLVTSAGDSTFGWFGRGDLETVREMTSSFSRVDQRHGGGHARTALVQYLTCDVASYLRGNYTDDRVRRDMFSAASELAYLAGWMAFDNAEHSIAQHYFSIAVIGRTRQAVVDMRVALSAFRRRGIPATVELDARASAYLSNRVTLTPGTRL
jgi:transcriptional regulator with XRE-family HTH domain